MSISMANLDGTAFLLNTKQWVSATLTQTVETTRFMHIDPSDEVLLRVFLDQLQFLSVGFFFFFRLFLCFSPAFPNLLLNTRFYSLSQGLNYKCSETKNIPFSRPKVASFVNCAAGVSLPAKPQVHCSQLVECNTTSSLTRILQQQQIGEFFQRILYQQSLFQRFWGDLQYFRPV